jgi:hypothetical protein
LKLTAKFIRPLRGGINGYFTYSKAQAKALEEFFKVSPELFI